MIQNKKKGRSEGPFHFRELWIYAIILAVLGGIFLWDNGFDESKDASWNEFRQMMYQGAARSVRLSDSSPSAPPTVSSPIAPVS